MDAEHQHLSVTCFLDEKRVYLMRKKLSVPFTLRCCSYPLVPSFSARIVLLGKVPQVVVVVEVEKLHEVLQRKDT